MVYEQTAEEIVRIFRQWELGAVRSPNPKVALNAPLEPPTIEEATSLLPRLRELRQQVTVMETDWHWRPVGELLDPFAMACLWEEWRDNQLGPGNGYRDLWPAPDLLYDGTPRSLG